MFKALAATLAAVTCLTAVQVPAKASSYSLAQSVSNIGSVRKVEKTWFGSHDEKLNINSVRVGDTISGIKIKYIVCEYQTKTFNGWRGGPEYAAFKGTYNCYAAASKRAVGPGASGPQLIMTVVRNVR